MLHCVALCCTVLHCVALCSAVMRCVGLRCNGCVLPSNSHKESARIERGTDERGMDMAMMLQRARPCARRGWGGEDWNYRVDKMLLIARVGHDQTSQCMPRGKTVECVAVCCSVLQCVVVCCSVLQCVVVCCSVLHVVALYCRV